MGTHQLICLHTLQPIKRASKSNGEMANFDKVLNRIDQYQKDQSYPEEYRTSPITSHNDFLLLLADRKLLSDYPDG